MKFRLLLQTAVLLSVAGIVATTTQADDKDDFKLLFNGGDLTGWVNVNGAGDTFVVRKDEIVTNGKPTGYLRSEQQYENFILEFDWMHVNQKEVGNSGVFVWGDALPAVGTGYTRSIEVQVLVNLEYKDQKTGAITATSHGDLFSIWGATCHPDRPHPLGWARCLPKENRAHGGGKWNHYKVVANDGVLKLSVNGVEVSGVSQCSPRKGYLALESEGAECHFKNIKIKELPTTNPTQEETATTDQGHVSLFNGLTFDGWEFYTPPGFTSDSGWKARDGVLVATGADRIQTKQHVRSCELIFDWKLAPKSEKRELIVELGGKYRTITRPEDVPTEQWRREVLRQEEGAPAPIQFVPAPGLEIRNIFARELDDE